MILAVDGGGKFPIMRPILNGREAMLMIIYVMNSVVFLGVLLVNLGRSNGQGPRVLDQNDG
jgi:hypothetical protein